MEFGTEKTPFRGSEFASVRRRLGLTQVGLASRLDCSAVHISRMENSLYVPTIYAYALFGLYEAMNAVRANDAA